MSLLQGDLAEGVRGPRSSWAGAFRVANRGIGTQLLVGVGLALLYLAANAASVDRVAVLFAAVAAAIALVWPAAGLATLAIVLPMPERDLFQPFYVVAVLLGATALAASSGSPATRVRSPSIRPSSWPSAMPPTPS